MEITFALPSQLAREGLEKITITIPPMALKNLCYEIQKEKECYKTRINCKNGKYDDHDAENHENSDGNTSFSSKSKENPIHEIQHLPILKAIQCYIMEAFRIDVRSFRLIRAACGVAALGYDGRCKPLDPFFLWEFLNSIHDIIILQIPTGGDYETNSIE